MEENRTLDCIVVGDALWDVIVKVKGSVHLTYGGTSYCDFAGLFAGGSANIAAGLSFLGGKAAFVGKVGKDRLGDLYLEDLKKSGVLPCIFVDDALPTGLITAFVEEQGERSFVIFRGANDDLSLEEIETTTDLLNQSSYVYLSGYSLVNLPQQDTILRAAELAKELGVKVIFDPAAHNLFLSKQDVFNKLLGLCDIFCPNFEEAKSITGIEDVDLIVDNLRKRFSLIALKLGSNGCVLANKSNLVKIPGFMVNCIDSTGAGDAFAAALIYGLCHSFELETIGRFANWFASQVVMHLGARAFPAKPSLKCFLDRLIK